MSLELPDLRENDVQLVLGCVSLSGTNVYVAPIEKIQAAATRRAKAKIHAAESFRGSEDERDVRVHKWI